MRLSNLPGRLLLMVAAAILPLAVVLGFSLQALLARQAAQTQASALGVARAVATAVDSELRSTIATLEALALVVPMGTGDAGLEASRALAEAVRARHPEWRAVQLAAPSGAVVFSTAGSAAAAGAEVVDMDSLTEVLRGAAPAVGALRAGPRGNLAFTVRVPVVREGVVRYVLTAVVRPEAIAQVLRRQTVPEGWTVSVFDSKRARVARNLNDDRLRGMPPSETLQALLQTMEGRKEVVGLTTTVEGVRVQAAVARLDSVGWVVTLGASVASAESDRRRTLWAYGAALLGSLCLAAVGAWWMSRAITRPMGRLRRDAAALGEGAPVNSFASGLPEIDAVSQAMGAAAAQRSRSEAEREQLLAAERAARATAQAAGQRLERLVGASARLSVSLEEASTLSAIAEVVVPEVADLCRIDLLDADGVLRRKLTHHFDPARSAQIAQMVASRSAPSDAPGSFPWAIATGQTFLRNLDDSAMAEITDGPLRDFVRTLGITAACVVPLVARGRTIGAMAVLQADSGRRFTPDDGVLIGELAQRAALALDNVRLLAEAKAAQAQAEAANRAKDEFLAMLGHELRNPLAPIALALALVARRDPQSFPREREIIERQVRHLSRMVDDLLDVSRIVSGKIALKLESVDLREVVARAVEQAQPAMQQRSAPLQTQLPEVPVCVQGDPSRLAQILGNLLNNAAKFTPPDGRIEVTLHAENGQAQVRVADEGIGIAGDLLPHVFERFVQGSQPLQRATGGLGLGLAIAQSLAGLHGGAIEASSQGEGRGSVFVLHLPLQGAAGADHATAPPAPAGARPLRLLLVDDNLDAVNALAEWCVLDGHQVRTAGSGEEALALLEAERFDGGIFDIGLPGISGYELARRVRDDPRSASMALVALTGYGQAKDRQHAIDARFDDHFAKPADVERMLQRLQELTAER